MSIEFHLENFPTLCQNNEDPGHEFPDVNAGMDCVPTSIAAALTWFTGQQYFGDEIIDAVYGASYQGGTSAASFVAYCAQRGVALAPVDGAPADLVAQCHALVHQHKPVLVTVPGQWNNPATSGANPGDVTHVMCVCGDGPGALQVMNPWTGAFEEYADSWFEVKLCYGQIWPMERAMLDMTQAATYFTADDQGNWHCKETGREIIGGILAAYRSWPANGSLAGLTALGLPLSNEIPVPGQPAGIVYQSFERGVVVWDPDHHYDDPPGVASSTAAYVDHWILAAPTPAPVVPSAPVVDLSAVETELADALAKVQAAIKAATAPASGGAATPAYEVREGDTLAEIASALGVNAHHLYQQNLAAIEAAAQEHGYARGSNNGTLLVAGTVLRYS